MTGVFRRPFHPTPRRRYVSGPVSTAVGGVFVGRRIPAWRFDVAPHRPVSLRQLPPVTLPAAVRIPSPPRRVPSWNFELPPPIPRRPRVKIIAPVRVPQATHPWRNSPPAWLIALGPPRLQHSTRLRSVPLPFPTVPHVPKPTQAWRNAPPAWLIALGPAKLDHAARVRSVPLPYPIAPVRVPQAIHARRVPLPWFFRPPFVRPLRRVASPPVVAVATTTVVTRKFHIDSDFQGNTIFDARWANDAVAVATTLTRLHETLLVDASSGAVTVTLPALPVSAGKIYTIKKEDSSVNTVTLDGDGATIDGASSAVLTIEGESITVHSNQTKWSIL